MSPAQKKSSRKPPPKLGQSTTAPWVKMTIWVIVAALVVGGLGFLIFDDGGDSSDVSADGTDSTSVSTAPAGPTVPAADTVANKPCVAMADPPPAGAPTVPVQVGPPPTQLVSQDLQAGTGATAEAGSTVTVDYIGVACSTGKVFDASYGQQPTPFALNQVIPGWQQGLTGMKVGGTRLLGIPPELAYGAQGFPPDIAPDETLWFVVELKDVQAGG